MLAWIMSDLHLESACKWDLPAPESRPSFDVMIVAGDLTTKMYRGVKWLRERIQDKPVLYIAGNHESYGTDWNITVEKARAAAVGTNIHVLQNDSLVLHDPAERCDVIFAGTTLWTDFKLFEDQQSAMVHASERMNDYRKIRKNNYQLRLRPSDTLNANKMAREFLANIVHARTTQKICVVSHHGPAPATAKLGTENDLISSAYVNGEHAELLNGIDIWIYGHTHETRDFTIAGTRIVTNAKGYGPSKSYRTWDNPQFDPTFTITI